MDEPEGIIISEISQTEKDTHCMVSLTCGILKKSLVHRNGSWGKENG